MFNIKNIIYRIWFNSKYGLHYRIWFTLHFKWKTLQRYRKIEYNYIGIEIGMSTVKNIIRTITSDKWPRRYTIH